LKAAGRGLPTRGLPATKTARSGAGWGVPLSSARCGPVPTAGAWLLLAALIVTAPPAHGQNATASLTSNLTLTTDILAQRISFESSADLEGVTGSATVSADRFKDGRQALLWEWSAPEPLIFHDLPGLEHATGEYPGGQPEQLEPSYVPRSRQGGLKLWVYRESSNPDGRLEFRIGADSNDARDRPAYRFEMSQNFTGWRALWVHFEEDARAGEGAGTEPLRTLRIEPSPDMADDRVYLDMLQLVTYMSGKRHSDWQFANRKVTTRTDPYRVLPAWQALGRFADVPLGGRSLDDDYQDFAVIEQRYEQLLLGSGRTDSGVGVPDNASGGTPGESFAQYLDRRVAAANREWDALGIDESPRGVTGMPLFASREEHPAELGRTYQQAGEQILAPLALDYRRNPGDASKRRVMMLLAHLADQGWAAGSALGTSDHLIRVNPYANAVFLLRNELRQAGLLRDHQRAIAWYTRFGALSELDTSVGENSDHIRGGAGPKLISVLLMEDSPEKVARMLAFRDYLIHVGNFAPGYADTIKPDYTIFHHAAAYQNVYGVQGVTTLAMLDWLMRGTRFSLPEETTERLRDTLMAQFDIAADFQLHPALSGRFPYTNSGIDRFMLPGFAFAAMEDNRLVEPGLGAALAWAYRRTDLADTFGSLLPRLNYYGSFGTLQIMAEAVRQAEGLEWEPPTGHFTFPYGAAANHKRPGWAASVRGWSRYVWDWESGHQGENPYGRYLAFGSLLLFTRGEPLSLQASGIDLDGGFHWAYAPGATTKALPMDRVLYEIEPTPLYREGKHRNFSGSTFAGGVSHRGLNGFYAMNLKDTVPSEGKPLFDDSFRARKSFLFVDNQVIALGSGIANDDSDFPTITTLFQSTTENGRAMIDGATIDSAHWQRYDGGVFTDPQGNQYIVPPGQSVVLEQSEQSSLVPRRIAASAAGGSGPAHLPVSAPHVKAWLDHGPSPGNGAYEYQILIQGEPGTASTLAATRSYRVHRRDNEAHVVEHLGKNLTAYAVFTPQNGLPGAVEAVDTPLLLIAGESGDELRLSLADPDLRLGVWPRNMSRMPDAIRNQPAGSHVAEIRLSGHWMLREPHPDVVALAAHPGQTAVRIRLDHGLTRELVFQPADAVGAPGSSIGD